MYVLSVQPRETDTDTGRAKNEKRMVRLKGSESFLEETAQVGGQQGNDGAAAAPSLTATSSCGLEKERRA